MIKKKSLYNRYLFVISLFGLFLILYLFACRPSRRVIYIDKLECVIFIVDRVPENKLPVNPMKPIKVRPHTTLQFYALSRNYLDRDKIIPFKTFNVEVIDAVGRQIDFSEVSILKSKANTNKKGISPPLKFKFNSVGVYRIKLSYMDKFLKTYTLGAPIIVLN